jgi:hypothetical protein
VRGTLVEQTTDKIFVASEGTNQFIIYSKDAVSLARGSQVEAIGSWEKTHPRYSSQCSAVNRNR